MRDDDYFTRVKVAMDSVDSEPIWRFIDLLADCATSSKRIFITGNGGSATTASHMAVDLGVGSQQHGVKMPVFCLTDNQGVITAVANDRGFAGVFSEQLRLLARPEDLLVCISVSGDSPNVVAAAREAKNLGVVVIAMTGFDGGQLARIADIAIHVPTEKGDYGPAEDVHLMINHRITERLRARFAGVPAEETQHA